MHIYPWQIDPTPSQLSINALNTATPNLADIAQFTYTHGRLTPPSPPIEHRSLENHYTKYISYTAQCIYTHGWLTPSQSIIDALKTTTPNLADLAGIAQCTCTHGRLTPPPPPIEHRCLEYHYTKPGRYSTMHLYSRQIDPTPSFNQA